MDLRNFFIPVAATPALQVILNIAGTLKLKPFAHWGWTEDIALPITYVIATGSAAVASLLPVRKNITKAKLIAIGIILLLLALWTYTFISTSPPPKFWLGFHDFLGYCSFFITYIAFGFVVSLVVKFFSKK